MVVCMFIIMSFIDRVVYWKRWSWGVGNLSMSLLVEFQMGLVFIDSTWLSPLFLRSRGAKIQSLADTQLHDALWVTDAPMLHFGGSVVCHFPASISGHAARPGTGGKFHLHLGEVQLASKTVVHQACNILGGFSTLRETPEDCRTGSIVQSLATNNTLRYRVHRVNWQPKNASLQMGVVNGSSTPIAPSHQVLAGEREQASGESFSIQIDSESKNDLRLH